MDGALGWCDRECRLCLAPALWNGCDDHLKERLFGLSGPEGNHGEDVKELYYYIDATPTHSYAKARYRYPHTAFPYASLRAANSQRGGNDPEYEILETGVFKSSEFFDLDVEYAKAEPGVTLIRYTVSNHGASEAELWLLLQLWYRNVWAWPADPPPRPRLEAKEDSVVLAQHEELGALLLEARSRPDELLFTENDSHGRHRKDAFHRYLVENAEEAVNPDLAGTKAALVYHTRIGGQRSRVFEFVLRGAESNFKIANFEPVLEQRRSESDEFYQALDPGLSTEDARVWRQAYAGLLFSKVFYHYAVREWLDGDASLPSPPPPERRGRNQQWRHLAHEDLILVPDTWEYPWYALWDTAFQAVTMARLDGTFAKEQLLLMLRDTTMHSNGQLPAYELGFSQLNPPVHAWACLQVYQGTGANDRRFLERAFHKLLLNYAWWLSRNDDDGNNAVSGGFLGMDNIGPFDRNAFPPRLGRLSQADGTAWIGFFSLRMLQIALLLAEENDVYEDIASKFFDHFVTIRDFLNEDSRSGLWHQEDRFYYDFVLREDDEDIPLRVRSLVGLLPLIAVDVIAREKLDSVPSFKARLEQRMRRRQGHLGDPSLEEREGKVLLSLAPPERVRAMLESLLDEEEFLSPFGIRSLSKKHEKEPFRLEYQGETFEVAYEPGESRGAMMGGNSNWRGPVWFPMNYLLINALRCYHSYHGDSLRVPLPSRGGSELNLEQVALELQRRLVDLLRPGKDGRVPAMPELSGLEPRELWSESLLFHEHFHGDDGRGLGSCHQTGWTALIAHCLEDLGRAGHRDLPGPGLSQGVLKKGLSDLSDLSTHIW